MGYTSDTLWTRTVIRNSSTEPATWLLRYETAYLDLVTVYIQRASGIERLQSGTYVPVQERALPYRQPVFPINFAAGETLTIFSKIENHASMAINTSLEPESVFLHSDNKQMFWLTAYFGMLLALGLYNLLLFVGLKERVFLLYSLFVFSFTIGIVTFNGIGVSLFWHPLDIHENRVMAFGFILSATFGALFTRDFLETKKFSPRWHRALTFYLAWCVIAILSVFLLPVLPALIIMDITALGAAVLLLSCGITCLRMRVPGAQLFVLAWLLLLTGAGSMALRNFGVLPSNFFTQYGIQIGSAFEMLILSFALAARFNKLKKQKEHAQTRMVETLRSQSRMLEEKVAQRTHELEVMATTDTLTGLLNRNGMHQQLRAAIKRCQRNNKPLTLLMLDLDNFKPVNDLHGHDAGDFVLQTTARRIQNAVRGNDSCARFGGDEFIVIAESVNSAEDISQLTSRLKKSISNPITLPNQERIQIGASIGVCTNHKVDNVDSLLKDADEAMYNVKKQQRGE